MELLGNALIYEGYKLCAEALSSVRANTLQLFVASTFEL